MTPFESVPLLTGMDGVGESERGGWVKLAVLDTSLELLDEGDPCESVIVGLRVRDLLM